MKRALLFALIALVIELLWTGVLCMGGVVRLYRLLHYVIDGACVA